MSVELLYTSAPQGLRKGSRGFCTVVSTSGMPINLATRLESLSAYRHIFPPNDPQAALNPVNYSHLRTQVGGKQISILSRIAAYGVDYSQRTNKIAHHIVLETSERPKCGPAALMQQSSFFFENWDGECRTPATGPVLPNVAITPDVCRTWQRMKGDAGWGGVVAEALQNSAGKPLWIVYSLQQSSELLQLIAESVALLAPEQRWNATFTTFFTNLPPDVECKVRFVLEGTDEARLAPAKGAVIKLNEQGQATQSPLVQAARTGEPIYAPSAIPKNLESVAQPTWASESKEAAESSLPPNVIESVFDSEDEALRLAPPSVSSQKRQLSQRKKRGESAPPEVAQSQNRSLYVIGAIAVLAISIAAIVLVITLLDLPDTSSAVAKKEHSPTEQRESVSTPLSGNDQSNDDVVDTREDEIKETFSAERASKDREADSASKAIESPVDASTDVSIAIEPESLQLVEGETKEFDVVVTGPKSIDLQPVVESELFDITKVAINDGRFKYRIALNKELYSKPIAMIISNPVDLNVRLPVNTRQTRSLRVEVQNNPVSFDEPDRLTSIKVPVLGDVELSGKLTNLDIDPRSKISISWEGAKQKPLLADADGVWKIAIPQADLTQAKQVNLSVDDEEGSDATIKTVNLEYEHIKQFLNVKALLRDSKKLEVLMDVETGVRDAVKYSFKGYKQAGKNKEGSTVKYFDELEGNPRLKEIKTEVGDGGVVEVMGSYDPDSGRTELRINLSGKKFDGVRRLFVESGRDIENFHKRSADTKKSAMYQLLSINLASHDLGLTSISGSEDAVTLRTAWLALIELINTADRNTPERLYCLFANANAELDSKINAAVKLRPATEGLIAMIRKEEENALLNKRMSVLKLGSFPNLVILEENLKQFDKLVVAIEKARESCLQAMSKVPHTDYLEFTLFVPIVTEKGVFGSSKRASSNENKVSGVIPLFPFVVEDLGK